VESELIELSESIGVRERKGCDSAGAEQLPAETAINIFSLSLSRRSFFFCLCLCRFIKWKVSVIATTNGDGRSFTRNVNNQSMTPFGRLYTQSVPARPTTKKGPKQPNKQN